MKVAYKLLIRDDSTFVELTPQEQEWWNKELEILKSHLKCFSLEKHIGVRRKEDTLNHATSYEILCEKENLRLEVKISHLKNPVSNMVIIWK